MLGRIPMIGRGLWVFFWLTLIALLLYPQADGFCRRLLIINLVLLWVGALLLFWSFKIIRYPTFAITIVFLCLSFVPGRDPNKAQLENIYVHSLRFYNGCQYSWGGESLLGIDCSGLIRRGWMDANFKIGLLTFNPSCFQRSLDIWWNDCTAKSLRDGYSSRTKLLFKTSSINTIDYSRILPGDMAVVSNGTHILAYIGEQTWIEADPHQMQVIEVKTPTQNSWFLESAAIIRWVDLDR
jgi:hypothetical protein